MRSDASKPSCGADLQGDAVVPSREVIATDCQASNDPGAWTCKACGFRGFWRGGTHCVPRGARHTPGPWHWVGSSRLEPVEPDYPTSAVSVILSEDGCYGFVGSDPGATLAEDRANHALIAAAPDLLDAARAAEAFLGRQGWTGAPTGPAAVALSKVRGAIAKATGAAR